MNTIKKQNRSGERYVYVETDFEPVLPQEVTIGNAQCRIWHYTQPLKCRKLGNRGIEHMIMRNALLILKSRMTFKFSGKIVIP